MHKTFAILCACFFSAVITNDKPSFQQLKNVQVVIIPTLIMYFLIIVKIGTLRLSVRSEKRRRKVEKEKRIRKSEEEKRIIGEESRR